MNLGAIVAQSREQLEKVKLLEEQRNSLDQLGELSEEHRSMVKQVLSKGQEGLLGGAAVHVGLSEEKQLGLLEQVVLDDLTKIHGIPPETLNLKDELIGTYSWDWATHINSMGMPVLNRLRS